MKSYLKFLSRNKLYTAIEAVGLIVSFAFIIIIAISVHDQRSLARPKHGQENLYLLGRGENTYIEYRELEALSSMPEVVKTSALTIRNTTVQVSGENYRSKVLLADPSLLEMIPLAVRSGDLSLFNSGPGVLITESAARKYFSGRDPIGQEFAMGNILGVEKDRLTLLQISAVIEDPSLSLLDDFEFMVSMQNPTPFVRTIRNSDMRRTGSGSIMLGLVELVPGADLKAFSDKMAPQVYWRVPEENREELMVTPYEDLLYSDLLLHGLRRGNRLYLIVLTILGLILLSMAVLNYINLSLAASGFRAKEMATRQLVGDDRRGVLLRCLMESTLFTTVCYILALLLTQILVPLLNSLRPAGVTVSFRAVADGYSWLMSLGLMICVGVLGGIAPAVILSSWRPIDVVSGRLRRRTKMVYSRICIIVQTAMALILIVLTISLHAQLRHLETLDLGVSPAENVFYFLPSFTQIDDALCDRLAASPMVEEMGKSFGIPTHPRMDSMFDEDATKQTIVCDSTAFRLLGFRPVEMWSDLDFFTLFLTEDVRNYIGGGETRDEVESAYAEHVRGHIKTAIGGILENYRKAPVNEEETQFGIELQMVRIGALSEYGLVIRTGPNRKAFEHFFRETVNAYYKEKLAYGDVFSDEANFYHCGYFDDIIAKDYDDLHRYVRLVDIFCLIAVLLAILGMVAMSTYYAGTQAKDVAIRKVFGGTVYSETTRGIWSYLLWVGIAVAIGLPVSVVLVNRFLEDWSERISGYWWIFVVAVLLVLLISFASVLWQTLKAARTNPAVELKKE